MRVVVGGIRTVTAFRNKINVGKLSADGKAKVDRQS